MKQVCLFIIALFAGSISLYAQSEAQGDSIRSHVLPDGTPPEGALMPEVKNYDGFLLDMSLLKMEAPRLPEFTLEIPDASKDYSRMFRLNPNATYSQGLSNVFSLTNCLNLRWKYRMQARITAECSVSIQMLPTRKGSPMSFRLLTPPFTA